MNAAAMMVAASFLFATMSVCVKLASSQYGAGEIVFWRGLIGATVLFVLQRRAGNSLRTPVPLMHVGRSAAGVTAMCLWFYSIGGLPLATATTMNYLSSVWMALFLIGGAVMLGGRRVEPLLVLAVLLGFAGVALVLRPSLEADTVWHALAGLLSGVLAALAYLQVTALGRSGEPEARIVFYFNLGSALIGAVLMLMQGMGQHTLRGAALLLATGVLALVAQLLITRAFTIGSTLGNAVLQYLGILFAYVYGVLLFDEAFSWVAMAGVALIVSAGVTTAFARSRQAEPPDTRGHHPGDG